MMNRTGIEWAKNPDGSQGYTWNPITGCLNHDNGLCKGGGFPCYAYKLANGRLRKRYLANTNLAPDAKGGVMTLSISGRAATTEREGDYADPFYPRFWEERLYDFGGWRENAKGIFVCDMGELFGDWIPQEWQERIFSRIKLCPQHRFYLLTKQPQNLIKLSPFPENCWVGVTVTDQEMFDKAISHLSGIQAHIKFISFEPLLEKVGISHWIGYNAEYESKELRGNGLQSSDGRGIRNRQRGKDLESQGSAGRQVEGREQSNLLHPPSSRERHREISPSENYDKREEVSCTRQQIGVASLQGGNTNGIDNQSQEREREGKSSGKLRASDLQPTNNTLNKCPGENLQTGQARPISWLIIGACTGTKSAMMNLHWNRQDLTVKPWGERWTAQPRIEWVTEIVEAADKAGIPVFLKDNLLPLFGGYPIPKENMWAYRYTEGQFVLRQEMPGK